MFESERYKLVEKLKERKITNLAVLDAFLLVERHLFLPKAIETHAYRDVALPIGFGQTISQPFTVAFMTQELNLQKGDKVLKKQIFDLYLKNTKLINNWDLVDLSAPNIVGDYLKHRSRKILYKLINSKNLWKRRIAILSTFAFIRNNDFKDALAMIKSILSDRHDLIHKAASWMLREIGKRNLKLEENFLNMHHHKMPRIMLRYAIEKFSKTQQQGYLN